MFGSSCAGKGRIRNAGCDETFLWIWGSEWVPVVLQIANRKEDEDT